MRPGPANLRTHEDTITALLDAGCSAVMATHAYNLVDSYVLGFALQEVNMQFSNAEELSEVVAQVPADAYPNLSACRRVSCSRPASTTPTSSSLGSTSSSTPSGRSCREPDRRATGQAGRAHGGYQPGRTDGNYLLALVITAAHRCGSAALESRARSPGARGAGAHRRPRRQDPGVRGARPPRAEPCWRHARPSRTSWASRAR